MNDTVDCQSVDSPPSGEAVGSSLAALPCNAPCLSFASGDIVFTSLHNKEYEPLAEITLAKNKVPYCQRHGYPLVVKKDKWHDMPMGFEKAFVFFQAFEQYPSCKWLFFSECDALITNMNITLESILEKINPSPSTHMIITTDGNGINAGNLFIRNSPESCEFLQYMLEIRRDYPHEQAFFNDCAASTGSKHSKYPTFIQIAPQYYFNSYEYKTIPWLSTRGPSAIWDFEDYSHDYFGNRGQWERGDFLIHWPSTSLEDRIRLAEFFSKYVEE